MRARVGLGLLLGLALALPGARWTMAAQASARSAPSPRPQGPCDIYAAAAGPCVRRAQHHARALRRLRRAALSGA